MLSSPVSISAIGSGLADFVRETIIEGLKLLCVGPLEAGWGDWILPDLSVRVKVESFKRAGTKDRDD